MYGSYFGFLATGSGDSETCDKKKAVCCLCKVVLSYSGNKTNSVTHLEHHCPAEYFLKESGRTSSSSSSTQATLPATRTHSQTLPMTSSRHKELVNAVHSISKDLLPLSAVEGTGTHAVTKLPDATLVGWLLFPRGKKVLSKAIWCRRDFDPFRPLLHCHNNFVAIKRQQV